MPARLDRAALRELGADLPPVLRGVVAAAGAGRPGNAVEQRRRLPLREELAGLAAAERAGVLADLIRSHMAAVLGCRPEAVPADRPFGELGFDSLTSVEFRNRLGAAAEVRLPVTLLFEAPTLPELVAVLDAELSPPSEECEASEAVHGDAVEGVADADVAALIEAADAEELFAFIDRRLA
ncbi:acyl carrier protein [Kitasatospora sp. NPDC059648]|uniref:acyl carrier protein n=1 Tax=Kitasatospora sp. NPDC059648 TaxID=3346894 RepID=UPI0036B26E3C